VTCISDKFTVEKGVFLLVDAAPAENGLRGTSSPFCRHPPILASQEQLAPRWLTWSSCWESLAGVVGGVDELEGGLG
jgi:hypothetical protein